MNKPNVFYVLVEKYNFQYKLHDLTDMYIKIKHPIIKDHKSFNEYIVDYMKHIKYNEEKSVVSNKDLKMSEDIMSYLKIFFNNNLKPRTLKRKHPTKINKTRKNIII